MDWTNWTPRERANLCFILKDDRVLLIRKKRGLGAGKINGPGGKLEPGETALASAIRETQEEIGVTPLHVEDRGVLHFQFTDGYSLHCAVFVARDFEGEPIETVEATPLWFPVAELPLHEMWEDDQHWLPQVLAGASFDAWFLFEGERMLEKRIVWRDATPSAAPVVMLDRQIIATLCSELDREGVEEMVRMFLDDLAGVGAECSRLLAAGEMAKLEREAHSLKGSSASLGAVGLANAARELEEASESLQAEQSRAALDRMLVMMKATQSVLEDWLTGAG